MAFIRAEGQQFTFEGKPVRLRGFGVGGWLSLEHYMIGMPASEAVIHDAFVQAHGREVERAFFHRYRATFLEEADFQLLADCGVNFLRVPLDYRLFLDDNHTDGLWEDAFAYLDRLLELGRQYGIFIMPDMHAGPGGQNPDWHSDNAFGAPLFWQYQALRRQLTRVWAAIAERYAEQPYLMGYDLLNEPAMADWPLINAFYAETIAAIRAVDPNHVIVLEGDHFSMDFSGLAQFDDPQLALGFHYYPTVWHPELLQLPRAERVERIAEGLDRLAAIGERFQRPAFCGEFGYGRDNGGAALQMELLEDTLALLEERRLDWVLWCYKDIHFMSMVSPRPDTAWRRLADAIALDWDQDIEKAQAAQLLDLTQQWFPAQTEEDRYLLQFRLRACLYVLQQRYLLLPRLKAMAPEALLDMAGDFAFERCQVDGDYRRLLERTLRA